MGTTTQGHESDLKTGFVTFEKADNRTRNSVGSTRIRARWVAKYWEGAEEWQIGKKYDVLIFQKVYWDEMMEEFEGIKILDLCDPDWYEGRDVMRYVDLADAVTTSTPALAEYVKKFFPDKLIECVPDRVDLEAHKPVKTKHEKKVRNAVWFGYAHNFKYAVDALPQLIERGIALTMVADQGWQIGKEHEGLDFMFQKYEYPKIHEIIRRNDIALMPMRRLDYRGKFKSNNKILTCAALGVPVIQYPEDFKRLESQTARMKESKKMLKEVKEKWDVRLSCEQYKDIIKRVLNP